MSQSIYPALRYEDAPAAIEFLKQAFGFEEVAVMRGDNDTIGHGELAFDGGVVMASSKSAGDDRFPGGPITIYIATDDPDAHHDHARAAGAEITMELTDQDYGSREYAAKDPEGNVWVFGTYRPKVPA